MRILMAACLVLVLGGGCASCSKDAAESDVMPAPDVIILPEALGPQYWPEGDHYKPWSQAGRYGQPSDAGVGDDGS